MKEIKYFYDHDSDLVLRIEVEDNEATSVLELDGSFVTTPEEEVEVVAEEKEQRKARTARL